MSRLGGVLTEALRMALAQPIATAVTAVIVAAACGVIVSTTGQTVAIERDVLGRIDDAGTRTIVVEDTEGRADLDQAAVRRIEALAGVEWVVGFGVTGDVRPAGLGGSAAVPIRGLVGELPATVSTTSWDRGTGTALAGVEAVAALGFATAAGPVQPVAVDKPQLAVVGWLSADTPLDFLNRALLTVADPDEPVMRIIVLAKSTEDVPQLADGIRAVLDPADPTSVAVQTSDALLAVRAAVRGELGAWSRNLVTLVLGAGLVLTALNVFGAVTARRRDFGRRRALGASRVDILVLVTAQTVATAVVGGAIGVVIGLAVVHYLIGTAPPLEFAAAVAVLAVIATAIAALPPAIVAAFRDPVRILRVA